MANLIEELTRRLQGIHDKSQRLVGLLSDLENKPVSEVEKLNTGVTIWGKNIGENYRRFYEVQTTDLNSNIQSLNGLIQYLNQLIEWLKKFKSELDTNKLKKLLKNGTGNGQSFVQIMETVSRDYERIFERLGHSTDGFVRLSDSLVSFSEALDIFNKISKLLEQKNSKHRNFEEIDDIFKEMVYTKCKAMIMDRSEVEGDSGISMETKIRLLLAIKIVVEAVMNEKYSNKSHLNSSPQRKQLFSDWFNNLLMDNSLQGLITRDEDPHYYLVTASLNLRYNRILPQFLNLDFHSRDSIVCSLDDGEQVDVVHIQPIPYFIITQFQITGKNLKTQKEELYPIEKLNMVINQPHQME